MNEKLSIRIKQNKNEENSINDANISRKKINSIQRKGVANMKDGGGLFSQNNTNSSSNASGGDRKKETNWENCKEKNVTENKKFVGENIQTNNKKKLGTAGISSSIPNAEKSINNKRKSINEQKEIKLHAGNAIDEKEIRKLNDFTNFNDMNELLNVNIEDRVSTKRFYGKGKGTTTTATSSSSDYPATKAFQNSGPQGKIIISSRNENLNDSNNNIKTISAKNKLNNEVVPKRGRKNYMNQLMNRGNNISSKSATRGKRDSHLYAMTEYPLTSKNIYDSIYIPQININNILNNENGNNNNNNNIIKRKENNNAINNLNAFSNVRVAVRIRPIEEPKESIVSIFNKKYVLIEKENEKESYLLSQKKKQSTYVFDVVFDVNASQEEVFQETAKPLIPHVFEGINCTVFAYGATGSGKTYTMLDDKNQNGIVQLSLLELFTIIKKKKCKSVKVIISFLEVYNETIRDLLEREKKKPLEVQEDVAEVKVNNLCEREVHSYEEAMMLITEGVKNRKISPTRANKVSSRSHAILQIYVLNEILDERMNLVTYKAKLCFVDLAGSERASATSNKGERFKEGSFINQSLLALANCINSLASNKSVSKVRVKYRDSKLTHLLKNSLEGNCLVVMIANINPSRKSFQESNNTLKYAFRARNIKLCATVHTSDNKETDLEKLFKKSETLQKEYNDLSTKYNNLKNTFSDFSYLFQIYQNALLCYREKEQSSDNINVLELKQKICIYEQFIKVKLDELKKKVINLDYDDEHNFLNILDATPNTNLNISLNNSCNILNEIGNQVPADNIFNQLNNNFSNNQINNNQINNNQINNNQIQNPNIIINNSKIHDNAYGYSSNIGRENGMLGNFGIEQINNCQINSCNASTPVVHSNVPPPTALSSDKFTVPSVMQQNGMMNEKINEQAINKTNVSMLKNGNLNITLNRNENSIPNQQVAININQESKQFNDKMNETNIAFAKEKAKTETETETVALDAQKIKSEKNCQREIYPFERKGSGVTNDEGVGRSTCFLNRSGSFNRKGFQHEFVLKRGGSTESIIMENDNVERMTSGSNNEISLVKEKIKKHETNKINNETNIIKVEKKGNEPICIDLENEDIPCGKNTVVDNANSKNIKPMKSIENGEGVIKIEDVNAVKKGKLCDIINNGSIKKKNTEQLSHTNELKKKTSSNTSSISDTSFVTTKSRDTTQSVVKISYRKEEQAQNGDLHENKRKIYLGDETIKHEHNIVNAFKPQKKRMKN